MPRRPTARRSRRGSMRSRTSSGSERMHRPEFKRVEASRVDKPWGYELRWATTDLYAGKVLHINKGEALSLQYHERKDEHQYLVTGAVDTGLGGPDGARTTRRMQAWDTLHIAPGTRHRLTAVEDTEIF